MPRKSFKCPKCDRKFSMPAHLVWHMQSAHGQKKKKATAKKSKRRPMKKGPVVTRKKRKVRRGRPKGSRGFKLKKMTLEQLTQVIDAARNEARTRLADLEASIG